MVLLHNYNTLPAIKVHCFAHSLNLCLQDAASNGNFTINPISRDLPMPFVSFYTMSNVYGYNRVSLNTGLDSPLEHGTGTWDWIIELECGTGIWDWTSILARKQMLACQTTSNRTWLL